MQGAKVSIVSDSAILTAALEQSISSTFGSVRHVSSVVELLRAPDWQLTVSVLDAADPKVVTHHLMSVSNKDDLARIVVLMRGNQTVLDFRDLLPFVGALMPNGTSLEEINLAARIVQPGLKLLPSDAFSLLYSAPRHAKEDGPQPVKLLTERELGVLQLLAEGCSNKTIARRLNVSDSTIRVHVRAILKKLKMQNRTQAALYAIGNQAEGTAGSRSPRDQD
ncbi:DNA-binding response regulator [Pseudorhizobium endolithicum]|uniref:DNA-binding response regulator n=1 Tax=Pseudorhizobium endolithicum TaxID=1191678 RepID=A0ABN7JHX6_9HYPH|nr:response regulator transcription factor [Pseudorhizobium endolithicum]CAD6436598.1 DNA-binding response regulator [Rhizobium sp. Q54]CAD7032260.1 DNA-binding response regulator [Pseudorhizobium endolithicum]